MSQQRGATLIDTVVGVALMLLIFVGIAGAFQLSVDLVSNNKARIGAEALAQEQLEYIRSLPYDSMAVVGGIPAGNVPQTETITLNAVTYTRRTLIRYFDDPKDGLGAADVNHITNDAKEIKVEVSWQSKGGTRTLALVSHASPPGIEQSVPGGTLSINVVNNVGQPVSLAQVRIVNSGVSPSVDVTSFTDDTGNTTFIGAPAGSGYQITATKTGFSNAQTYSASSTNPNPSPGNLTVANNTTTSATFPIDYLATLAVSTYKQIELLTMEDLFSDASNVATTTNVTITGGVAQLSGPAPYPSSGEVQSNAVTPSRLYKWQTMSWTDVKPAQTAVAYSVYYQSGSNYVPVPDADLPGNSAGFTASPVDISSLSTTTYPWLRLRAALSTSNANATPSIDSWRLSYLNGPDPLPNISFTMHGNKTIGSDAGGAPIYKYNQTNTTNASGFVSLPNLDADTYTLAVSGTYDIAESCTPQPNTLAPSASSSTALYLAAHTTNSLLVDVKGSTGALLSNAVVRVYRTASPAYDTTQKTSTCGQTFFPNLNAGSGSTAYSIDVTAGGYQPRTITNVTISGASRSSVILNP